MAFGAWEYSHLFPWVHEPRTSKRQIINLFCCCVRSVGGVDFAFATASESGGPWEVFVFDFPVLFPLLLPFPFPFPLPLGSSGPFPPFPHLPFHPFEYFELTASISSWYSVLWGAGRGTEHFVQEGKFPWLTKVRPMGSLQGAAP